MDWTRQLPAYVAWVNSQLRKTPGCRLVSDLKSDLQDGTTLSHLLETVSGVKISGIVPNPKTVNTKRQNVENLLQFMNKNGMETRFLTAKGKPTLISWSFPLNVNRKIGGLLTDVNDGNIKSIMRLILEIAKNYKPTSVTSNGTQKPSNIQVGYGSLDNRRQLAANQRQDSSHANHTSTSSGHGLRVVQNNDALFRTYARGRSISGLHWTSVGWQPYSQPANNNHSFTSFRENASGDTDGDYAGTDSDVSGNEPVKLDYRSPLQFNGKLINGHYQKITDHWNSQEREQPRKSAMLDISRMVPAKSLPCLQKCFRSTSAEGYRDYENVPMYSMDSPPSTDTLLRGHSTNNVDVKKKQGTTNTFTGTPAEVKLVALQSYLHQTSEKCHDLHSNLQKAKQECATLEDVKDDLQTKIMQQDKQLLEMKQELAKLQLTKQSLETEKEELSRSLQIKDEQLIELRRQLGSKDKVIYQQKNQFDDAIRNLSMANKAKACLTGRLADQDRKIALLEHARSQKTPMREELQVVHDALHSLRNGFRRNDPQHHTIDTLEQSFSLLMDRLHLADIQKMTSNQQTDAKRLNLDSTGDPRRSPLTSYHGLCLQKLDNTNTGTKVVYFTEKTVTPFMSSISKRLGEIHLKDFKAMFDRPGNYRFHFKSVDPEYGMVKEEILQDDDVLPGWDGKIIAWVEEDHG